MPVSLIHGDCLETFKNIESNSIDSLVTDPPAGISFMGKDWDSDKGGRDGWITWMTKVMTECIRVLKPGAHGLVWAIPRTSHWTATALENAGFEVRDIVTHLFGSGFPKSMNISIAIDKQAGAMSARGKAFVTAGAGERKDIQKTSGWETDPGHAGITDAAKQWQGWGTALKPASEHWILIRKPCSEKTVAANVLKHGTGGINIDASRVGTNPGYKYPNGPGGSNDNTYGKYSERGPIESTQGRFPANLILSHSDHCLEDQCDIECAIKMLDEQSGPCPGPWGKDGTGSARGSGSLFKQGGVNSQNELRGQEKATGASRFFYCAKASKKDKGADNSHPTVKASKLMSYLIKMVTPPNGIVLDPFAGSGSTGVAALKEGFRFLGIEQNNEYLEMAKRRLTHQTKVG